MIAESDLSLPQFAWPLSLTWVFRNADDNKVEIRSPSESIVFEDVELWGQSLEENLKQHIIKENKERAGLETKHYQQPIDEHYRHAEHKYPNNHGSYIGEWVDGRREGRGSFVLHNNLYNGGWKNDKKFGRAELIYSSGEVYHGTFLDNLQRTPRAWQDDSCGSVLIILVSVDGRGKLLYPDGTLYVGEWVKGFRHGRGKLLYANGDAYEGYWENDTITGMGRFISRDGMRYEGWLSYHAPRHVLFLLIYSYLR